MRQLVTEIIRNRQLMRLGFAVATEVDPDILLMDEILAVGDAAIQQTAFSVLRTSMGEANHIGKFCQRALWIDDGALRADGPPDEVIARYDELLQQPVEA
jgi:lipopolysaccharide transport system ATP-binding protein